MGTFCGISECYASGGDIIILVFKVDLTFVDRGLHGIFKSPIKPGSDNFHQPGILDL